MKIGYVSTSLQLGCTSARTFRLASYSPERLYQTVGNNLICLLNTLHFNASHNILFFRLTSDLVPFASHPICDVDWITPFRSLFTAIGEFARAHDMRLGMHPGQYTLLNSPDERVVQNSVRELVYHALVLDALGMDQTHKMQIHVGGAYGDKEASIERFAERYTTLPLSVRRRLVVENDDRLFTLQDCLTLHRLIDIPIVFDNLHHVLNNQGEPLIEAFALAHATWREADGLPVVDYSSQAEGKRAGNHAASLDPADFAGYLQALRDFDFDIMLEIKDKDASALQALAVRDSLQHRL